MQYGSQLKETKKKKTYITNKINDNLNKKRFCLISLLTNSYIYKHL